MKKQLCKDIETALCHRMQTPKDFENLRERIYARLHVLVSRTTLMRLWGYVEEDVYPRLYTLNTLAQYLGYQDWEEYNQNALLPKEQQSTPILSRRISVIEDLVVGDCLRLTWQPNRTCDVFYKGELTFCVISAENTRLRIGNTFCCSVIIEGEPLYIDNLKQGNQPPIAYVCGKKTGVMFEYVAQNLHPPLNITRL